MSARIQTARRMAGRARAQASCAAMLLGVCGVAHGAAIDLHCRHGMLAAAVEHVPLERVVDEIVAKTGATLVGRENAFAVDVSTRIACLPIAEAIARLLAQQSYVAMFTGAEGMQRLTRLVLLRSTGDHRGAEIADDAARPVAAGTPFDVGGALVVMETSPEAVLEPVVVHAVRAVADQSADATLRLRALRALAARRTEVPDLDDLLLRHAYEDDDADVRLAALALVDQQAHLAPPLPGEMPTDASRSHETVWP